MLSDFELRILRASLCPHDQARLDAAIVASHEARALRGMHNMRAVVELVAHQYHVTVKDILSRTRREHVVAARQLVAYVIRVRSGKPPISFPEIGLFLNRDHSTVIHAYTAITKRVAAEPGFAIQVNNLLRDLCAEEVAA